MNTFTKLKKIINSIEKLSSEEQTLLVEQLQQKKENIALDNPWIKYAGMFKDDPQFEEFITEIKSYRQELDILSKIVINNFNHYLS